jgi:hypothetical protein
MPRETATGTITLAEQDQRLELELGGSIDSGEWEMIAAELEAARATLEEQDPTENVMNDLSEKQAPHMDATTMAARPGGFLTNRERDNFAPPFYSAVEHAVTSGKEAKASPDQWLGTLKNMPASSRRRWNDWASLEDVAGDRRFQMVGAEGLAINRTVGKSNLAVLHVEKRAWINRRSRFGLAGRSHLLIRTRGRGAAGRSLVLIDANKLLVRAASVSWSVGSLATGAALAMSASAGAANFTVSGCALSWTIPA